MDRCLDTYILDYAKMKSWLGQFVAFYFPTPEASQP